MKSGSKVCTAKGDVTKEKIESTLVGKLQGVFRPDKDSVGRLVNRRQGSNRADVFLKMDTKYNLKFGFGKRQERHVEIVTAEFPDMKDVTPVYLPPKEIVTRLEEIPDGCAECFPFELIDELKREYLLNTAKRGL